MTPKKQLHLGASIRRHGYNQSSWLHPDVNPAGAEKIEHFVNVARIAEEALFDSVFLADLMTPRSQDNPKGSACRDDGNVELEPITLLAALAMRTKRIGLVATASTSYNEPFHVARKFASLDHISGGRAGWNAVTSFSDREARNFSRAYHVAKDERYERATEFLEVVLGLWNSWEADAFVRDKASGIFYDQKKLHVLNYQGKHFSVQGPLTASRTPQGRPIVFQAGASEHGLDLAGQFADAVYSVPLTVEQAIQGRKALRDHAVKFGRHPDHVLSLPGCQIFVGRTAAEARDKFEALKDRIDPIVALENLKYLAGDLYPGEVDMRAPVPDEAAGERSAVKGVGNPRPSWATNLVKQGRQQGWTNLQLCQALAMGPHMMFLGTADEIASAMQTWFESGAADGFNILPPWLPGNLAEVAEHIVPRLQDLGLFRKQYEGSTLRENLGLPMPRD